MDARVLRADITGMPTEWVRLEDAIKLICCDQVVYTVGETMCTIYGGINAKSGKQSFVEVNSIICTRGQFKWNIKNYFKYIPPLTNRALFKRDSNLCLYCGAVFFDEQLSRDHVIPLSRGGSDSWSNAVTACKRCNSHKGNRTPEEAGLNLLAVPFAPTHAEYIFLSGRHVMNDQMQFLLSHFPRNSPLHRRYLTN